MSVFSSQANLTPSSPFLSLHMKNSVLLQRNQLRHRHYIRKADPTQRYWFDFALSELTKYKNLYGENFSLIIAGDAESPHDYYTIPFPIVSHIFSEAFLAMESNGEKRRWIGSIDNDYLKITRFPDHINIRKFKASPLSTIEAIVAESFNVSHEGHTKETLVLGRIDQSIFRQKVAENFDSSCAISGITEMDLLIASHIIPWSVRSDIRLDPSNGILLYVEYDYLFDKGFITFDENLNILITPLLKNCSPPLELQLRALEGKRLRPVKLTPIGKDYLRWHYENCFRKI